MGKLGHLVRHLRESMGAVVSGEFGTPPQPPAALPGGEGAHLTPQDVDPEQLALGTAVEMEHTKDPRTAMEIALDHLAEDPKYYDKLLSIGL
jgi:hypothetical protein